MAWWWSRLQDKERQRSNSFEQCAQEAVHELYPELEWTAEPPIKILVCRVCKGSGYHVDGCALISPDKKKKASVEDLLKVTDKEIQKVFPEELHKDEVTTEDVDESETI